MKTGRFSESQIIGILKQQEAGMKTADICREHGISQATFYNWKAKYGGLDVSQLRRLKELGISPQSVGLPRRDAPLGGKTFVLTGTLETISRGEAAEKIRTRGGSVSGAVSGETDYVVAGSNAGSKLAKAQNLGIKTLNEAEFLALIGVTNGSATGAPNLDADQPSLFG